MFDSHAHIVSADRAAYPPNPLRGELSPGEFDDPVTAERLIAEMDANGVARACAVQRAHVYGYDNRYVLDSAARFPDRLRAVVVLDPADPETPARVGELVREHAIAGVRYSAPSFPHASLDWLLSDAAEHSWRAAVDAGLPVCIHVLHVQRDSVLPALERRIAGFPTATVVVDHVGGAHAAVVEQRWLSSQGQSPGAEIFAPAMRLAEFPGVVMKVSDINLEGSADPTAFVRHVVAEFGPERVMWGSDVGQSRGSYAHMVRLAREAVEGLPVAWQSALLRENAERLYV